MRTLHSHTMPRPDRVLELRLEEVRIVVASQFEYLRFAGMLPNLGGRE